MTIPTLDPQAKSFLTHLWRVPAGAPAWAYWWHKRYSEDTSISTWFDAQGTWAALPSPDREIYFGVHPTAEKGTPSTRSKKETVSAINCLYAELDAKDGAELATVKAFTPAPSVVVASGGGWHCYWLLAEPYALAGAAEREQAIDLQRRWVEHHGGDLAARDLARVLRVPGTVNRKPERNGAIVTFLRCELDRLYPLDFLAGILPAPVAPPPAPTRQPVTVASNNAIASPAEARRRAAYLEKAIADELNTLAATTTGRNARLNKTCFALGQLVAGNPELNRSDLESRIQVIATDIGLKAKEIPATIRSGMNAGLKDPRPVPSPTTAAYTNGAGPHDTTSNIDSETPPVEPEYLQDAPPTVRTETLDGTDKSQGYVLRGAALWFWREVIEKDVPHIVYKPVADFHLKIVGRVISEDGTESWQLAGAGVRAGPIRLEIAAAHYGDMARLTAAMEAASSLDGVYPGQHQHLRRAIKALTDGEPATTRRYNRTGWADGRFLLPGREPEGVTVTLPVKLPYSSPPSASLSDGLRGLAAVMQAPGDAGKGAALVAYILQGPAAKAAGLHNERYALFVTGRTGSLKTSTAQAAMSIYGAGWTDDTKLIKWGEGATRNAIMAYSTQAHDLPFVLDNFKPGTGDGAAGAISLIHNIVEGSDRDRVMQTGELRHSKVIAAWPLCTGEDVPVGDAAAIARILVLPFTWQKGEPNQHLSDAQSLAEHMPAVGGAWVEWLEGEGGAIAAEAGKGFPRLRAKWADYLRKVRPDMVNILRVASNLAGNELIYWLACEHPQIGPVLRPHREALESTLRTIGKEMGSLTVESLEAHRWLSHVRALAASGRATILHVNASREDVQKAHAANKLIGFSDSNGVYLLPTPTLAAIKAMAGQDAINGISQQAIGKQLVQIGAIVRTGNDGVAVVKKIDGTATRVFYLRSDILTDDDPEPVGENEPEDSVSVTEVTTGYNFL